MRLAGFFYFSVLVFIRTLQKSALTPIVFLSGYSYIYHYGRVFVVDTVNLPLYTAYIESSMEFVSLSMNFKPNFEGGNENEDAKKIQIRHGIVDGNCVYLYHVCNRNTYGVYGIA